MSYRPQFAYRNPPAPCDSQKCQYSFDSTNTPKLGATLAAGASSGRIPLILDVDADFYLRAIESYSNFEFVGIVLSLRLEAPGAGDPLSDSDNAVQSANYAFTSEYSDTKGASVVPLESGAGGVFCPGGGNFSLYLFNGSASPMDLTRFAMNLHGIKVYSGGCQ